MKMTDAERIYVEQSCKLIVDLACAGEHEASEKMLDQLMRDNIDFLTEPSDDVGPN